MRNDDQIIPIFDWAGHEKRGAQISGGTANGWLQLWGFVMSNGAVSIARTSDHDVSV